MRYLLFSTLFLFASPSSGQDSVRCTCSTIVKAALYPKKAEDNKISGSVIIEWEVSEQGFWSDPIVKKSLGYGCDEEALKVARFMKESINRCRQKCGPINDKKRKIIQTFRFQYTEE